MTAAVAVGTPPPLDGEPWTARATVQSDAVCQFATATIRSRNLPVALALIRRSTRYQAACEITKVPFYLRK